MTGRSAVIRADAHCLPLADSSVDLVITSPPYFALRSYTDGGQHYAGQVGDEATPQEFIDNLLAVTAECVRVLKPTGSLWVNLGDGYAGSTGAGSPISEKSTLRGNGHVGGGPKAKAVERGARATRPRREGARMTREDAAWLAGVIDSDGSVSVHVNQQPEGRAPSFVAWVRVGQMRPEVVTHIAEVTGIGKVMCDGRRVYSWQASAQQARWVLERIHPWLLIKKRQAWAAVEVARHVEGRNGRGEYRPLTLEDVAYRQRLRDAVLTWNRGEQDTLEPPEPRRVSLPYGLDPKAKSLRGLPWRYALGCIDQLGLILRAEVVWSKCLSGGTRVYAEVKGRQTAIKLHDLCRRYRPQDVRLWTGAHWSQVRAWEPTGSSEVQFEIELRSGERIGCTAEHRWPAWRGVMRTDELRVGDVIQSVRLPEGTRSPSGLDDLEVGWFVGLYIAEGSRSEQTIQIAGHVKEDDRFRRLFALAERFDGTCKVHATGGNTATINLTGPILRAILEQYVGGKTSKDKHLRPRCWERSNDFLTAVLSGYLSGDGSYDESLRRWSLGFTNNDALAEDLRTIAARIGVSLRLRRTTHYGFGQQWPGWGGTLYEDPSRRRAPDSEIVAVRPSRARQFWDIEIEDEPHLFALASGVLTHNSNGLPESMNDRVRRSHEQWFHLVKQPQYFSAVDEIREPHQTVVGGPRRLAGAAFAATMKNASGDGSRHTDGNPRGKLPPSVWTIPTSPLDAPKWRGDEPAREPRYFFGRDYDEALVAADAWRRQSPSTRSLIRMADHFAAFPPELPRRIILGWSPQSVCVECNKGRMSHAPKASECELPDLDQGDGGVHRLREDERPVGLRPSRQGDEALSRLAAPGSRHSECHRRSDEVRRAVREVPHAQALGGGREGAAERAEAPPVLLRDSIYGEGVLPDALHPLATSRDAARQVRATSGLTCSCPPCAPTRPAVVIDPFGGTGTTAMVARALGRTGLSFDLSHDYSRLARWRTEDAAQRAKVRGEDFRRPEQQLAGQLGMFDAEPAETRPSGGLAYAALRGRDCPSCGYRTQYAKGYCDRCHRAKVEETA